MATTTPIPNGIKLTTKAQAHFVTFLNPSLYGPALTEKAQAHFLTFLNPPYIFVFLQPLSWRRPLSISLSKIHLRGKIWRKQSFVFPNRSSPIEKLQSFSVSKRFYYLFWSLWFLPQPLRSPSHPSMEASRVIAALHWSKRFVSLSFSWRPVSPHGMSFFVHLLLPCISITRAVL